MDVITILVVGTARSIDEAVEAAIGLGVAIDALIVAVPVPSEKPALAPPFEIYANCQGLIKVKGLKVVFADLGTDLGPDLAADSGSNLGFNRSHDLADPHKEPIDILVTRTPDTVVGPGSNAARDLAVKLSPWYHFSAGNYYESEPFYMNGRGTRLVELSNVNGPSKWFHIVRIGPGVEPACAVSGVNFYEPSLTHPQDIVWGRPIFPEDKVEVERPPKRQKRPCYMCLKSDTSGEDLMVKVGETMYLTTAKGPIYSQHARDALGCSGHVLLIPREHIPSVFFGDTMPEDYEKIQKQVVDAYERHGLDAIIYEFVRPATIHGHTQIVPVPKTKTADVLARLKDEAHARDLQITSKPPSGDYLMVKAGSNTVYLELPPKIDLQLPRRVICHALGVVEQESWQKCVLKDERTDAQRFKELLL